MTENNCYDVPEYWDLAFGEDTVDEADFIQASAQKYCSFSVHRLLEPGCGGGRLVLELARRGYEVTGWDLSQRAVDYANSTLRANGLSANVVVADMVNTIADRHFDVAYCLVNTFRHLLTEDNAERHLKNVAQSLSPGGLYILGMHLFPPDADEEDEEEWSHTRDGVTVSIQLSVAACNRQSREETLRFFMTANDPAVEGIQRFRSDYRMRLYEASQFLDLLAKVPQFELLDVYDFWYDIDEPLQLSDDMGDTVFILRRNPD